MISTKCQNAKIPTWRENPSVRTRTDHNLYYVLLILIVYYCTVRFIGSDSYKSRYTVGSTVFLTIHVSGGCGFFTKFKIQRIFFGARILIIRNFQQNARLIKCKHPAECQKRPIDVTVINTNCSTISI